jgi:uncharacterized damage-inducible protein DinB
MTIGEALLPEFDQEMKTTRAMLARVPSDKGQWKPHPKSFSMAHLAQLVSWMPGWIATTLREPHLDLGGAPGYTVETTDTLLRDFDKNVANARAALESARDQDFGAMWSLQRGGQVLFSAPRSVVVRMHISHLVHHRGQLSVYLRLNDVPVPPIYGPTADERTW